jgi:hypothetical protein
MRLACLVLILVILSFPAAAQEDTSHETRYFYTYQRADGNRFVDGKGTFPDIATEDWPRLLLRPVWIVGSTDSSLGFGWANMGGLA